MDKNVVVRFAPSPTGYLHIGGARTAIFNWLYSKKHNGKFILRIEDTDAERSNESSIQGIIAGLEWLGIVWDEGPYFQSEYTNEHLKTASNLIQTGHAYPCYCTKEELDHKREMARKNKITYQYDGTCLSLTPIDIEKKNAAGVPYTIRMKVPKSDGAICFNDVVYGTIEKKYRDIEDFVIVRSNGMPLYVFSNAVDDIRDKVTHIIRGQDGLANAPKQILIYEALGAPIPVFAHMSLTLDPNKAKISKRKHGEMVAVHFYKNYGFLPWALVNFLVRLGWATQDSKDIFSKEELIEAFDLKGISRVNSVFNVKQEDHQISIDPKALMINAHYLRNLPVEEIAPQVKAHLIKEQIWSQEFDQEKQEWFLNTVDLLRARYQVISDFSRLGRAFFSNDYPMESKALEKNIKKHSQLKTWFPVLADRIGDLEDFSAETLEKLLKLLIEESGLKPGILVNAIRTVVTGQAVGPEFFDVLLILGKDSLVRRIKKAQTLFCRQSRHLK